MRAAPVLSAALLATACAPASDKPASPTQLPAAPAPPRPVPLTKANVAAMAPEELARRVFGDLAHVMFPLPYREPRYGAASQFPLQSLSFLTRPRRSYRSGLCETDLVVVAFERMPYELGSDPAVRPYRFATYETYFVQDLAKARKGDPVVEEEAVALEIACVAIDPRKMVLVSAASAFTLVDGLDSLADLVEAAKEGRALAPLDCRDEGGKPVAEAACLRDLAQIDPAKLYNAQFIEGCGRKEAGLYCRWVKVSAPFHSVDIQFEFRGGSSPSRVVVAPTEDLSSITN